MASSCLSLPPLPCLSSSSPPRRLTPPLAFVSPSFRTSHPSSARGGWSSFPVLSAVSGSPGGGAASSSSSAAAAAAAAAAAVESDEGFAKLLEGVEVFDVTGRAVPILDLWRDRKAVVGFARHFGCVLCRKRADLLACKKDAMDEAGVALVLIGPGSTDQAKAFMEQTKFKGEVYADPSHSSFKALKFVSGVSTTFTAKAGLKIIESYMEGRRQDWGLSFEKDTVSRGGWQQGGILVAGPGSSNASYFHKDIEAGDDPDIEEVMRACCM